MVRRKSVIASGVRKKVTMKNETLKSKAADSQKTSGVRPKRSNDPPVQSHEAIWLEGPVPSRYWDHLENRRLYVRWLGQKLGFRKWEDWYRISSLDFKRNSGGGLLQQHWNSSAIGAVKECFPDYDWKDWLFTRKPRRFWQDPRNHRRYMKWLGQELGIRRPSDWYGVANQDFTRNKGGGFLIHYDSTVSAAIMSCLPNYDWKEWMFDRTPKGFWQKRTNRRRYMIWLGKTLGFKRMSDWYSVTGGDFHANFGNQCLRFYGRSPIAAMRDCFPRYTWNEWMFTRVPIGFWNKLENRKRYVRWLGKKLKLKRRREWYKVRRQDFLENYGGGLLVTYGSHFDVLKECIPKLDWEVGAHGRKRLHG